ncbi:MAG: site-2 protease family protein [Bradymonadales bacterium]|nr:site-2 protease family protein [Bradymonadales bacterium]
MSSHPPDPAPSDRPPDPFSEAEATAVPLSQPPRRLWLHLLLFLLTLVTATQVGLSMSETWHTHQDDPAFHWYASPMVWLEGFSYSASILAILLAHEMGHYLTARRHGVPASLPYFIPMISAFGTLGAFIRMRLTRRMEAGQMMRIGAYGPLAGFVVALPVLVVGLALSQVRPAPDDLQTGIVLGDSLLMLGLERLLFGEVPAGYDIWLHPMAFAGWAGLFVTALNLLPLGQLDGGHVAYCLFGRRFNQAAPYLYGLLVALAVSVFTGWLMLCILLLFIGVEHPPVCSDLPVQGRDRAIGIAALVLLVLTFTPVPFGGIPTLIELLGL